MIKITVKTSEKTTEDITLDKFPDECPYCHRGIDPNYLYGFLNHVYNRVQVSLFCPKADCHSQFIGVYSQVNTNDFYLEGTILGMFKQKEFSEIIKNISKDFVDIFSQASVAEENRLSQICGVGYRKALEFLMKDYIISRNNELRQTVEKDTLSKCINEHINNLQLKEIAKRATWLGNDETHYTRKWVDKSINDLKMLIDLTVHWIETETITDQLISGMPE